MTLTSSARFVCFLISTASLVCIFGCDAKPSGRAGRAPAGQEPLVVESAQQPIVDTDYQFQITSPGRNWRLMSEKEFGQVMPDAVAGAVSGGGAYGAIIVEKLGGGGLEDFAKMVRDNTQNLLGDTARVSEFDDVEFNGLPAKKFSTKGQVEGMSVFYQHRLVVRDGFGFQIVAWSVKDMPGQLDEFYSLVKLLDGPIKQRAIDTFVADYNGPGQRIRSGDFVSPVFGVSYKSVPQWKTLVGPNLTIVSPDSIVGFQSAEGSSFGSVIAEFVKIDDFDEFREQRYQAFEEATGAELVPDPSHEMQLFGKTIPINHYQTSTTPVVDYYYGVAGFSQQLGKPLVLQLQLWSTENDDGVLAKLKQGASGLGLVSSQELKQLQDEYLSLPDSQNVVGPDYSLRRGVFRDFESGTVWTKPKNGIWKIHVGDAAIARNEVSRLVAEEILSGVSVILVNDAMEEEFTNQEYHEVVQSIYDAEAGIEEPITVQGTECLAFVIDQSESDLDFQMHVVTTISERNGKQVIVSGPKSAMQKNKALVTEAINGFAFSPSGIRTTKKIAGQFQDLRLGYKFSPPGTGWSGRDTTPPQLSAMGSMRNYRKGRKQITLGAMTIPSVGNKGTEMVKQMVESVIRANFGNEFKNATRSESNTTISGCPAKEQVWRSPSFTAGVVTAMRDSTVFFAIGVDGDGSNTAILAIKSGFKLLD